MTQHLTESLLLSTYSPKFLTTIPLCPGIVWEINDFAGTKLTGASNLVEIDASTYTVTIKTDNMATVKNNYIERYWLRGYSKAKVNPIMPKDIYADLKVIVEVCGWEVPSNPSNL